MRSLRSTGLACAFALAAGPIQAQTPTLNRTGSGARAAGMGNAFVAVSDDGTAASWNPAGLAQLRKPEFALVYTSVSREQRLEGFRSADGRYAYTHASDTFSTAAPEFLSLAAPFDLLGKATTIQMDWRRQYNLADTASFGVDRVSEQDGGRTPLSGVATSSGTIDLISAALAMRLSRRVSVGASVSFWSGQWQEDLTNFEPGPDGTTAFAAERSTYEFDGTNLNFGVLLTYPAFNVGLVYHAPFRGPFHLAASMESSRVPAAVADEPDAGVRFDDSFAAGIAWRPGGAWTLALDVTRDSWSGFLIEDCGPCGGDAVNFFDSQPQDLTSTRDTTSLNLGAERLFTRNGHVIPLRFGLAYEPQGPMDSVLRDPLEYVMTSLGGGYNTNSFKLDAAVQYRWGRAADRFAFGVGPLLGEEPVAIGDRALSDWRVKVSLIYRVTDTDKLRGLMRRVFGDGGEDEDPGRRE